MFRPAMPVKVESDDVLAGFGGSGSGAAFSALVARHRGAVSVIAMNLSSTLRDAEQVLQQTFLAAWQQIRALPAGASFITFLYRIAIRTALAQRPREQGTPSLEALL